MIAVLERPIVATGVTKKEMVTVLAGMPLAMTGTAAVSVPGAVKWGLAKNTRFAGVLAEGQGDHGATVPQEGAMRPAISHPAAHQPGLSVRSASNQPVSNGAIASTRKRAPR